MWILCAEDSHRFPWKPCLIKYKSDINVYNFENWLFSIVISLKKRFVHFHYMRTYTIRIKQYETKIIDLKRGISVTLWKGQCHLCMKCHIWNYASSPFNTNPSIQYFSFLFCRKLFNSFIMGDWGFQHKLAQSVIVFFYQKLVKWTVLFIKFT